jgi:quaternary ammonium compound-resistance protein SugE
MTEWRDTPPSTLGFATRPNLGLWKSIAAFVSLFPACYLQEPFNLNVLRRNPQGRPSHAHRRPAPPSVPTPVALSRIWNRPSLWSRESQRERARDVAIAWAYLIAAGLCEVGWPIGLKWTQEPGRTVVGAAIAVISLAISGGLLFLAQRDISLGTSYAVWTGIGAAGTFLVGVWLFGDPSSFGRWLGATLIIAGVITLKLAH